MTRLNMILALTTLACALGLVSSHHQARKLFRDLEREQERARMLEIEWGQLQLEQSTWAAHARVERVARDRLSMIPPETGRVLAAPAETGQILAAPAAIGAPR